MLDHLTKAALLLVAVVLLGIAAVRRCTFVGVIAVVGFGCAVVGLVWVLHDRDGGFRGPIAWPAKSSGWVSGFRLVRQCGIRGSCRVATWLVAAAAAPDYL